MRRLFGRDVPALYAHPPSEEARSDQVWDSCPRVTPTCYLKRVALRATVKSATSEISPSRAVQAPQHLRRRSRRAPGHGGRWPDRPSPNLFPQTSIFINSSVPAMPSLPCASPTIAPKTTAPVGMAHPSFQCSATPWPVFSSLRSMPASLLPGLAHACGDTNVGLDRCESNATRRSTSTAAP